MCLAAVVAEQGELWANLQINQIHAGMQGILLTKQYEQIQQKLQLLLAKEEEANQIRKRILG